MKRSSFAWRGVQLALGLGLLLGSAVAAPAPRQEDKTLLAELKTLPYRIVHETCRDGRWTLVRVDADGSNPTVLTRTPGAGGMYPHVSPDGTKICFVCDEGEGKARRRNVYLMNMDGSGRTRIAEAGRDPCWAPDGKSIVYLRDEFAELQRKDFATKGLSVYDVATGKAQPHVNEKLHHLYNVCGTPDGNWYVATVHAGMGTGHGNLAIETRGTGVHLLRRVPGCRPDVSPDGKKLAWGASDCALRVGDLKVVDGKLQVVDARDVLTSPKAIHIYHVDWSPDGRYLAFSRGPTRKKGGIGLAPEIVSSPAVGWNICVADAAQTNRWVAITSDGKSNKEPDWVPVKK